MADKTAEKQPAHLRDDLKFQAGKSGNPAGRPKGARTKLGEAFLKALQDDFEKDGIAAIQSVRCERPQDYIKVIASLLPKELSGPDGEPLNLGDAAGAERALERVDRLIDALAGRSRGEVQEAVQG